MLHAPGTSTFVPADGHPETWGMAKMRSPSPSPAPVTDAVSRRARLWHGAWSGGPGGWLPLVLCAAAAVLWQQMALLEYRLWEDEAETIVVGRMMAAGGRLYGEIFNLHGPLVFLPAWLLAALAHPGIAGYRWLIVVLQWAGLAALALSPAPGTARTRILCVMAAAVMMVIARPGIWDHTFQYQTLGGILTLCVLASGVLPAIANAPLPGRGGVVALNGLVVCLPFLAISYGPAAVLLFAAGLRRARIGAAVLGAALGVTANLAFLIWKGSIAGYLAYHVYLNLRVLPPFLPMNPVLAFLSGVVSAEGLPRWRIRRDLTDVLWVVVPCAGLLLLSARARGRRWPSWRAWLTVLALGSFLVRGAGFQAAPFWYGILAIPLLAFPQMTDLTRRFPWLPTATAFACVAALILGIVAQRPILAADRIPKTTAFAELARRLTGPEDRIIAYTFNNHQYILADRLPASGHFFYLPLQAAYGRAPVLGVGMDPCADIRAVRPKLILLDDIGLYGWPNGEYGGCLDAIVSSEYTRLEQTPYHIRNDLMPLPAAMPRPPPR